MLKLLESLELESAQVTFKKMVVFYLISQKQVA
jgi:hypothetical protein